jgi:zinc protease
MPTTPAKKDTTYDSKVPQAIALVSWKTAGLRNNQKESRRLNVVASILSDRLREEIREKLGASYSPNAGFDGSQALENFGYISAMSVGKPEDLKKLSDTILMIGNKLGSEGATADELDRSLKPTIASIEKTLRDNSYWLQTVLSSCQEKPEVLDLARDRSKDYASITLEEINALAKKYLVNEGTFSVTIQSSEEK